jgi:ElaB/YqjD/DUF883 family membrane-anchored ribosome-binding protein
MPFRAVDHHDPQAEYDIMNEHTPAGGAGPAIAAHSKDGSAPRHDPGTTGDKRDLGGFSENLSELSDKASEGVERVKASVREATGNAREALSGGARAASRSAREALAEGGRAADQAVEVVRDQPLIAMAMTGAICLLFGILLGRR